MENNKRAVNSKVESETFNFVVDSSSLSRLIKSFLRRANLEVGTISHENWMHTISSETVTEGQVVEVENEVSLIL